MVVPAERSVFRLSPDVTGSRIIGPLQVAIGVFLGALNALPYLFSRREYLGRVFWKIFS